MRLYKPVVIIAIVAYAVLFILCGWLVTQSAWWWLLFVVVALWAVISLVILSVLYMTVRAVRPQQTKEQKQQLVSLVDKFERVKEVTTTPKLFILFRVARDAVRPTGQGFISNISRDATSLTKDFSEYRDSFRQQ